MDLQVQIKNEIKKLVKDKYNIDLDDFELGSTPKEEMGDFAFGAFIVSKKLSCQPMTIVSELTDLLSVSALFQKVEQAGPYINLFLNQDLFVREFLDNYKQKNNYPVFASKKENILVDYIGANVGKPLHIGHMCTPNQGQAMINIYKKLGYNVIGDNHWGDWGIIFGKLITAYEMWGDQTALEQNAINHLFELYVKITSAIEEEAKNSITSIEDKTKEAFKKLSKGDLEYIKMWQLFTSYSISTASKELKRLNVEADYNIGESFYEGLNLPKLENYPDLKYNMSDIVAELISKKVATTNEDNSVGVIFDEKTKIPSCMLQKRDGTKGYLASDLAAIKYRIENWNPSKIIYFVDVRQQLHLKQVFETAKMAGWLDRSVSDNTEIDQKQEVRGRKKLSQGVYDKVNEQDNIFSDKEIGSFSPISTECFHAYNGFISLKDGAMSTRKGRIVKLSDLLEEAISRAKKIILEKRDDFEDDYLEELREIIGIGAIKYGYLSKNRTTDVIFDWDEFMTFEGNSGPYIQYAYVRARNIISKSSDDLEIHTTYNYSCKEEIALIKEINSYSNFLTERAKNVFPHVIAGYAYNLTKKFNAFYNRVGVLQEENEDTRISRLKLVEMFSIVIKDVFSLLAIKMPEKM